MPSSASHLRYAGCRCRTERVVHRARTPTRAGANPLGAARPGWGGHSRSTGHAAPAGRMDGGVLAEGRRAGSERDWAAASRRRHEQQNERAPRTTRRADPTQPLEPSRRPTRPPPFAPPPTPSIPTHYALSASPRRPTHWLPDLLPRHPSSAALDPIAAAPPPAHPLPPGLTHPGLPGRSRKGGPARSGGPPFFPQPRREAKETPGGGAAACCAQGRNP
jgi:hypothetical protein